MGRFKRGSKGIGSTLFAFPTCMGPILLPDPLPVGPKGSSDPGWIPDWTEFWPPGPLRRFLFSLLVLGGSNWPMGGIFAAGRGVCA